MTTPLDIITQSLKDSGVIGVGQTASAEDAQDALYKLNQMISQWNRKRWLVYHLITLNLTSTGAQSYTVGTGGDFSTPRPDRIESAFFRQMINSQPNQIDYPLEILEAREDYNRIRLKTLQTFPAWLFYDSGYPLGTIYPWPVVPSGIYGIFISVKAQIDRFTSLSQTIVLPPEYEAALHYNLCVRLRPAYQLPPDPTIVALAKDSLNLIRGANAQIPRLAMPPNLVSHGKYNYFSDT